MVKNLLDFSVAVFILCAGLAAIGAFAIGHEVGWHPFLSGVVAVVGVAQIAWFAIISAALSQLLERTPSGERGVPRPPTG